MNSVSNGNSMS